MILAVELVVGGIEWIWIILLAGVLLFGSKKIPEVARAVGKAMGEFQKGRAEIEREISASTSAGFKTAPPSKSLTKTELQKAAAAVGIDATIKSEDELREEIKRKLNS